MASSCEIPSLFMMFRPFAESNYQEIAILNECLCLIHPLFRTGGTLQGKKTTPASGTRYCGKPNTHVRASCHSRAAGVWLFRGDDSSLARSQTLLECDY